MATLSSPPAFHLLAKPTGAICNLDCKYCFFLSKEMLYPGSRFRMADELLETYIRQLIEAHRIPEVTIAWQGGEQGLNYLCAGYKAFLHHIDRPMRMMGTLLQQNRAPSEITNVLVNEDLAHLQEAFAGAQPDDPCPCGSGRKFKNCHRKTGGDHQRRGKRS